MITSIFAQAAETGLLTRTVLSDNISYDYQVYVPSGMTDGRSIPLILFLHGITQRGEGGFVPSTGAQGRIVRLYLEKLPAVVVLPQCRPEQYWTDDAMERMAMAAVDQATAEFGADPDRVYITGVSMGGYGAWGLAARNPGRFAAVMAICGGSPLRAGDRYTEIACGIGRTPVWAFHGADDDVVPVSESREMVEAVRRAGGIVRYSEYPGTGHNVWLKALGEPDLLGWLLEQRRPS